MSWFDPSGIASLAKNALKEAQKTIDKALDIKDEDHQQQQSSLLSSQIDELDLLSTSQTVTGGKPPINEMTSVKPSTSTPSITNISSKTSMKQSISNPSFPASNIWGSFTGSFFDNPNANDVKTVTTPPSSSSSKTSNSTTMPPSSTTTTTTTGAGKIINKLDDSKQQISLELNTTPHKPQSQQLLATPSTQSSTLPSKKYEKSERKDSQGVLSESSESIEIMSPPTTPGSGLTSPGQASTVQGSESIGILSPLTPASTSELLTVSSSISDINLYADSVEIISDECIDDDVSYDDDSKSYNTVSETTTAPTIVEPLNSAAITKAPSRSGLHLPLSIIGSTVSSSPGSVQQESAISENVSDEFITNLVSSDETKQINDNNNESIVITQQLIDDSTMEKSIERFEEQTQFSDSTQSFEYVNNQSLIQSDHPVVMVEMSGQDDHQENSPRGDTGSPNSSDGRSDIVKINSEEPTSGHTSADEVETATSSDIEIISSPNGDSSSTNSAYKVTTSMCQMAESGGAIFANATGTTKKKGHFRESSTHSIQSTCSEDSRFGISTGDGVDVGNCSGSGGVGGGSSSGGIGASGNDRIGSSKHSTEIDRLTRRVNELSEVLESREFKLMELARENADLNDRNMDLQSQLETKRKRDDCLEVTTVTEEYTHRLSALEKKFQQSIRERDNLRDQLKITRTELTGKITKDELDTVAKEKDFMIQELKNEGDKLAKQILQQSNIIKKLRTKEKESDGTQKRQKDQLDEFTEETDRLKKSLSAKDEVERSQIEAIHKMSSENRKLEREVLNLKGELEDQGQKLKTIQTSFDAARKEVTEKTNAHVELRKKTELLQQSDTERDTLTKQNQHIHAELVSLREKLRQVEGGTNQKEQILRQENSQLLIRLEDAEQKLEEQAQSVTMATIPLVRQLEALQTTLNQRTSTWERQEKLLLDQLNEQQTKLQRLTKIDDDSKEQTNNLNFKIQKLEDRLSTTLLKSEQTSNQLQQKIVEFEIQETDYRSQIELLNQTNVRREKELDEGKNRISELKEQLDLIRLEQKQRRLTDSFESSSSQTMQQQQQIQQLTGINESGGAIGVGGGGGGMGLSAGIAMVDVSAGNDEDRVNNSSPTLSLGRMSMADSLSSNLWPLEDIDCISNSGRTPMNTNTTNSVMMSSLYGNTSLLENLQAALKQRDGENHQLQWELSRLQADRNVLTEELTKLSGQLETTNERLKLVENIEEQFNDLQQKYDALLQMYGEKVEEIQELNLDLQEVKDIYRIQIDEMMLEQKKLKQQQQQQQHQQENQHELQK